MGSHPLLSKMLLGTAGLAASGWLWWYECKTYGSAWLAVLCVCLTVMTVMSGPGGPPSRHV